MNAFLRQHKRTPLANSAYWKPVQAVTRTVPLIIPARPRGEGKGGESVARQFLPWPDCPARPLCPLLRALVFRQLEGGKRRGKVTRAKTPAVHRCEAAGPEQRRGRIESN